jgi:O-antigen/teichoic acid export membrane protein
MIQDFLSQLLKVEKLHIMISVCIGFTFSLNTLYLTKLRFNEDVLNFAILRIGQVVIHTILAIVFVIILDYSWIGRYVSHYIPIMLLFFWIIFLDYKTITSIKINKLYPFPIMPQLVFGISLIPHALSSWVKTGLDRFFLSDLPSMVANGIYSAAFQFSMIFALIGIGFNKAFGPAIFKSIENNNLDNAKVLIYKFSIYNVLFTIVVLIIVILFSHTIIPPSYEKVIDILPILIIGQSTLNIYLMYSNLMFFYHRVVQLSIISITTAIVHTIMLSYLIVEYQEYGASFTFLVTSILQTLCVVIYINKKVK